MAPIIIPIPQGRGRVGPPMTGVEAAWFYGSAFVASLVAMWFLFTMMAWLMPYGEPKTLPQVLGAQWRWMLVLVTTGKPPRAL